LSHCDQGVEPGRRLVLRRLTLNKATIKTWIRNLQKRCDILFATMNFKELPGVLRQTHNIKKHIHRTIV